MGKIYATALDSLRTEPRPSRVRSGSRQRSVPKRRMSKTARQAAAIPAQCNRNPDDSFCSRTAPDEQSGSTTANVRSCKGIAWSGRPAVSWKQTPKRWGFLQLSGTPEGSGEASPHREAGIQSDRGVGLHGEWRHNDSHGHACGWLSQRYLRPRDVLIHMRRGRRGWRQRQGLSRASSQ